MGPAETFGRWWLETLPAVSVVLVAGSLAARWTSPPARRARVVVLTVAASLIAAGLGATPLAPRWLPAVGRPPSMHGVKVIPPERLAGHPARVEPTSSHPVVAPVAIPHSQAHRIVPSGWHLPPWSWCGLMGIALGGAAALVVTRWLVGLVLLARIQGRSRPAAGAVRERFRAISGLAGLRVRLLESDEIAAPVTYTGMTPTILLPPDLCRRSDSDELGYALAHEWSHVERHDYAWWTMLTLAGTLLSAQPLYWWLLRQLRLSQDWLADDRAAAAGSREGYAAFLVRLARGHAARSTLPVLGIGDRRSDLRRRVVMIVADRGPLERRCRPGWTIGALGVAALVIVGASGLRLVAASPALAVSTQEPKAQPGADGAPPAGETLRYHGMVQNKETGTPIAGATVIVRRSLPQGDPGRILEETVHWTDGEGRYEFTIAPDQVAEPTMFVELSVQHPDFADLTRLGESLATIRKNELLGVRPFFERIELRPARPISGQILTPEGKPAGNVLILAYSRTNRAIHLVDEYGFYVAVRTDADGRFRVQITTPGRGVFWVLPDHHAATMRILADDERGELGPIRLTPGVRIGGRALDADGKPLAGLLVQAHRDRGDGPDAAALGRLMVSDEVERTTKTDADGRFTFEPLATGTYQVIPTDQDSWKTSLVQEPRRRLPGSFVGLKVKVVEGEALPAPLEIRPVPQVMIEGRWVDSEGRPSRGQPPVLIAGSLADYRMEQTWLDPDGRFSLAVPRGLGDAALDLMVGEQESTRYRVGKDGPLQTARRIHLGQLDRDVRGIEVVLYRAPTLLVHATRPDGTPIPGFQVQATYTDGDADPEIALAGGVGKPEAIGNNPNDGRIRTRSLLPDREFVVTVSADGFAPAERRFTLPEGKIEETTFVLTPR